MILERYLLGPLIWVPMFLLATLIRLAGNQRVRSWASNPQIASLLFRLSRLLLAKKIPYAENNLQKVLPTLNPDEIDEVRQAYFSNMLITASESLTMDGSEFYNTRFEGEEHLSAAREAGQAIMFVSGHFDNWELNRRNIERLGFPIWELYRGFDNTRFNYLSFNKKHRTGDLMAPTTDIPRLIEGLKNGDHAHILVDLKVKKGRNGVKLPFAGQPAWTSVFAAEMAIRFNMLIIPTYISRTADGGWVQSFEAPLNSSTKASTGRPERPPPTPTKHPSESREAATELTRQINASLSERLLDSPASWLLWDTNRWGP